MSEQNHEVVRTQTFDADGPVELDVEITSGTVDVRLDDTSGVLVEVRRTQAGGPPWAESAAGMLNWVGEMFGGQLGGFSAPTDSVGDVRIEQVGERVVVRGPKATPPMASALAVTVRAPRDSHVRARTKTAAVTVRGTCRRLDVNTGSSSVTLDHVADTASVRTSSGEVDIATLGGSATVNAGSAGVRLGTVSDAVLVRTTSGEITIDEATAGSVEAISGTGDIRVGVARDITAEIDLSSGGGTVHSDLEVSDVPPDEPTGLTIRARSGSGRVLVTRA
ncbi:DUF4097 family beta strand repeat-containing protein [Saccharomonospora sp. NB11]|jgi:hypothetical protein|uniref:DUF4097 family beta strand repeat-containing protein n=1 Tax=Saccharomonospora sp. NB11 TaxID=1642298 RepID=UPI0018D0A7A4|nr:DUF4097 family beta strand repeat-containing protein [Saccharomonospora sp. NB11]